MAQGHDRRPMVRGVAQVALVPAAALLVHQLRYWLAFGGGASAELARQGHSYLHSLVPWIMLGVGLGVGTFLYGLGRALRGQTSGPRYTLSLGGLWLVCSSCLVAIYVGQESARGVAGRRSPRRAGGHLRAWAAGGRSPPPCVSGWCSPWCSMALAGCWMSSRSERIRPTNLPRPVGRPRHGSAMSWFRGSRRWPRVGRVAVRRADPRRPSLL